MIVPKILPLYLFLDVLRPTVGALGVMLGLVWMLQGVHFLDFVINKGLGLDTFLELTGYLVPMLLVVVLPLACVVGVAWGLRRLSDDNELLVLLATGVGKRRLAAPALLLALGGVALGLLNTLWGEPASMTKFKDLQNNLRTMQGQILLEEGTFNQVGNLMVYLQRRLGPTTLQGLLVHDARDPAHPVTWLAKEGSLGLGPDGTPQLVLDKGMRQEVGTREVSMLEFDRHVMDIRQRLGSSVLAPRMKTREEYGWKELFTEAEAQPRERGKLLAEASKRIFWPLAPLPLVLVAAAFLLQRPQRHVGTLRKLVGIGAVTTVYFSLLMAMQGWLEKMLTTGDVAWVAAPALLPLMVGLWGAWMLGGEA